MLAFRRFRHRYFRPRLLLITAFFLLTLDALFLLTHRPIPIRISTLPPSLLNQTIFIASIHRNSEYMLRLYWNRALLKLVRDLGPENVFVSILESGSLEDTKGALNDLKAGLDKIGARNKVELGISSAEQVQSLLDVPDEGNREGWIFTGRGKKGWEVRRIPYLAGLRNRAMEPLGELKDEGRTFDKVLWINDVVFTTEDVLTLLATRDGEYAAACALDFSGFPLKYYDTFALRDSSGAKTLTQTYPYFYSGDSVNSLLTLSPIPVKSCWNGIISMDAEAFYSGGPLGKGIRFRGVSDDLAKEHLEGSECCLIHADNPLTLKSGIFLNPNVRVSYNASTYSKLNSNIEIKASEPYSDIVSGVPNGDGSPWPGNWELVGGIWRNRVLRWGGWGFVRGWWEGRRVEGRIERWRVRGGGSGDVVGKECLINEMQVLWQNGWLHV